MVLDYALLERMQCEPHAVGEAKTPWMHVHFFLWKDYSDEGAECSPRQGLGKGIYPRSARIQVKFQIICGLTI